MQQRPTPSSAKLGIFIMAIGAALSVPIAIHQFGDALASERPLDFSTIIGRVGFCLVVFLGMLLPVLVFKRFAAQRNFPRVDAIYRPVPWIIFAIVVFSATTVADIGVSIREYGLLGISAWGYAAAFWICPSIHHANLKRRFTFGTLAVCCSILLIVQDMTSVVGVLMSCLLLTHLSQREELWWPSGW
jgi:hypothetical protein